MRCPHRDSYLGLECYLKAPHSFVAIGVMSSFSVLSSSFVNDSPINAFVRWKENLLEDYFPASKSKLRVASIVLVGQAHIASSK